MQEMHVCKIGAKIIDVFAGSRCMAEKKPLEDAREDVVHVRCHGQALCMYVCMYATVCMYICMYVCGCLYRHVCKCMRDRLCVCSRSGPVYV